MKNIFYIPLLLLAYSAFGQEVKNDSVINQLKFEITTLNRKVDSLRADNNSKEFNIGLKDFDKIPPEFFKAKENDFWNETLPFLFPILIALIGALFAIHQIRLQSRYSLIHTRANNISEARIKWNNDLRIILSKLIKTSTELHYHLRKAMETITERNKYENDSINWKKLHSEADEYYQAQLNLMVEFLALTNEVQLYLDVKADETGNITHIELEKTLSEYIDSIMESKNLKDVEKFNSVANELIRKSRNVLNDSWDKARNEGKMDLDIAFKETSFINSFINLFRKNKSNGKNEKRAKA